MGSTSYPRSMLQDWVPVPVPHFFHCFYRRRCLYASVAAIAFFFWRGVVAAVAGVASGSSLPGPAHYGTDMRRQTRIKHRRGVGKHACVGTDRCHGGIGYAATVISRGIAHYSYNAYAADTG